MRCAPQPYRIMRKMNPAQIAKYKIFCSNCMARTPNHQVRSHHAHGSPKELVGSFLLIVAKRGIKWLERLVHGAYRIKLRSQKLLMLFKSLRQANGGCAALAHDSRAMPNHSFGVVARCSRVNTPQRLLGLCDLQLGFGVSKATF